MSSLPATLTNNKTLRILRDAEAGGYGVVAMNCYDLQSCIGTIRAAEKLRAPAIIEVFPVWLTYWGKAGLKALLMLAEQATVPIAIHLDHATTDEDIDRALTFAEEGVAFDSIMVDSSHADSDDENIAISKKHITRATALGIACEVELGRLEGGEAGLRVIADGQLTDPKKAERFMRETGATLLAPCIGNLHGRYLKQPELRFDILRDLDEICKPAGHYLVLHGTDDLEDPIWLEAVKSGCRKFNINSWARDPMNKFIAEEIQKGLEATPGFKGMPDIYEEASDIYSGVVQRFIKLLGSEGMAA